MPVLKNAKHERFAQLLAEGKTADAAYQDAGYRANRGNASELKSNQSVQERVAELLDKAADKTVLTVARVTENLVRIAGKGESLSDAPGLSVARASWMDAAKLNGLVSEKVDLTVSTRAALLELSED